MKRFFRFSVFTMAFIITLSFMPLSVSASSDTVRMTGYDQVYKNGNSLYCAGAGGIYKVTLKNGKVKSKKCLVQNYAAFAPEAYQSAMRLKGKYLYYLTSSEGTGGSLNRTHISTGKTKYLAVLPLYDNYFAYAIKNSRIYYYKYDPEDFSGNPPKRVMKLNGKNNSKTSKRAVLKHKKSNAAGYTVTVKEKDGYYKDYLKTPKGTFYLGKAEAIY